MKLDQILNNSILTEGEWVVKSINGVEKRFPKSDIAGRDAWSKSYANSVIDSKEQETPDSLDLDTVWRKIENVVFNILPDGDPIDWLSPWLRKHGIKDFQIGHVLDKAAQKNGYKDIYDYYDQVKQLYSPDLSEQQLKGDKNSSEPEIGDVIRTKKMQMQGKVEKIEPYKGYTAIYFRTGDGRLMRTPAQNVTVIENLTDSEIEEVNEIFPYDVDHMPGRTAKGDRENKTIRYFYNEWKELADRANFQQHNNGLVVSSGPQSVVYQGDDGTIYAHWDKQKKIGYVKGKTVEGSMGGINRSAPAVDVSYEKVLDEVMDKWKENCRVNELSIDTMQKYRKGVTDPANVQTRPLGKLAKSVSGFKQAGDKIAVKTGDRSGNRPKQGPINSRHSLTYEERLSQFLNIDEDFTQILQKQHDDKQDIKRKPVVDIPFHGWTIRYRPSSENGEKVSWLILNKKHEEVKRGESMSDRDAVNDAQEWIKAGGGTKQQASSNVTIDFNVDFAKELSLDSENLYVMFDKDASLPLIYVSTEPQAGFKKTHIRNQRHKMTATTTGLPMVTLSAKESNALGLQPNGRYILGDKYPIDDNTAAFPLIFQGIVQGKGDMVKMGKPGLTVAHSRDVDKDTKKQTTDQVSTTNEVYQGPWHGDPEKYAKAPKSSTWGKGNIRLSDLVQDTIREHGIKWAFEMYVKKHGMPPRHFKIYAGL